MIARPSSPPKSARGLVVAHFGRERGPSAAATYGGLVTTRSNGPGSVGEIGAATKFDASVAPMPRGVSSRDVERRAEISVAMYSRSGVLERERDGETAAPGADVDDVSVRLMPSAGSEQRASSISSSVSGRGISTAG